MCRHERRAPTLEGAEIKNRLEQIVDAAYRKDHRVRAETLGGHDVEPFDRRMADALISLLRGETVGGGKPVLIVTIDADQLTAEVGPGEPIPIQTALAMVDRSEIYAAILHGTTKAKLVFGTNRRLATPLQKLALALFHPTCASTGCDVPHTRTEAHHAVPVENGGATDLANLVLKCPNHHHDHEQQRKRGGCRSP